ncbi:MAG: DUF1549 and DUF1553 domain-containing protein [Gemmataceae bacterium]
MRLASRFGVLSLAGAIITLLSTAPAHADIKLPTGQTLDKVDFERHVMGLLGRMGCNLGSCHGSFQGKGGFQLSLFGWEPEKDIFRITREGKGRRLNVADPEASLLLLKATGQVEHGGGMRFARDSWQYQVFVEWLRDGALWSKGSGTIEAVRVEPSELAFAKAGEEKQLVVKARFSDGSENDITAFCDFRTNDDGVADVSNLGLARSVKAGSTALVVSYRGNVIPVNVLVPMQLAAGFVYPKTPENNFLDGIVFERLKKLHMVPSDLSGDAEFLRRVTIDTIGQLPTPEDVRAFLADKSPDKRAKKIDELLAHPLHASMWATKFSDITGNDTQALENPAPLKPKRSQMWHDWFRKRVGENMPYDQIVHGVLCATSRDGLKPEEWVEQTKKIDDAITSGFDDSLYASRHSLDLYWRRQQNQTIELWGERTAAAFMGIRLECAQCHKHPFDRWSQVDYRAYANLFAPVAFGVSPEGKKAVGDENERRKKEAGAKKGAQLNVLKEIYIGAPAKTLPHPDTGAKLEPRAPGGPEIRFIKGQDPREELFAWLVKPENPFFARSFVNRIWGHYFGVGIVHPVDDFSLGNPPSNEKLLDALAQEFIKSKFDIRHIERLVLNSRVYQLGSKVNETNKLDKVNYARSYIRPMMAETVVDVLNDALGTTENFGPGIKTGSKAMDVGASQLANPALTYAFRIFGRPPRTTACDCERAMEPALPQKLFLMTDPGLLAKFNAPAGRLQGLLSSKKSNDEVLDELFLATLSRSPSDSDRKLFNDHLRIVRDRRAAFTDTLWALINTREFILNH